LNVSATLAEFVASSHQVLSKLWKKSKFSALSLTLVISHRQL